MHGDGWTKMNADEEDSSGHGHAGTTRVFVSHVSPPPLLGLLLVVPLLLLGLAVAAIAITGGVVAALALPFLFRGAPAGSRRRTDTIELAPDQYSRVDGETRRLPGS